MKRLIVLFCICLSAWTLFAQTTRKIQQLEQQRNELKQQIAESETLLQSTKKDVKSQLGNLALISGQIEERQKYIQTIENDVNSIQQEINRLEQDLKRLQKELSEKRQKYEQSVKYLYRNKSIQDKLMFIFSAENFGQMYRRMRYVREYADYQRVQGIQVQRKQKQVTDKAASLRNSRKAKEDLLKQGEAEKAKLVAQEQERKQILSGLQKKQRSIQSELAKQRRSADKLNAQIDRLIEEEIEKARKRAEEEARRKAEEARKKVEAAKGTSETSSTETKTVKAPVEKLEAYKVDSEDRRLSSVFEKNKGILPVPITGPYVVVGHYGQYQVKGLRNVKLDNKGIDIKGKAGANARVIFDGEVSAVFQYNGLTNVLVRHGSYISVYCNLSTVRVKKGSLVRARDVLGEVHTNAEGETILHFQLRKETVKLNPELWIHR